MSAPLLQEAFAGSRDHSKTAEVAAAGYFPESYVATAVPIVKSASSVYKFQTPQSSYTCTGASDNKILISPPNNGFAVLNSFRLMGTLNLSYVWTGSGSDPGYATVLPSVCRGYSSLIKKVVLNIGYEILSFNSFL